MNEWIRKRLLLWFARLLGVKGSFPVYRSTDGTVVIAKESTKQQGELVIASFLETAPVAEVVIKKRIRVTMFHAAKEKRNQQAAFWIELSFLSPEKDEWMPMIMLHEVNFGTLQEALHDAERFLSTTDRSQ